MPSSTSSSSTYAADRAPAGRWGLTWLVVAGIVLAALIGAEAVLRAHGHEPSVVDDANVWSAVRSELCSQPSIALLGASRIQTDIDMDVLRARVPTHTPLMLAVENTSHEKTLHDLANETCFAGVVICSVRVPLRSTWAPTTKAHAGLLEDERFIKAYHDAWSPRLAAETWLRSQLQSRLTLVHPEVGLRGALGRLARRRGFAVPMYLRTSKDRSRRVDFARANVSRLRSMAAKSLANYEPISISAWVDLIAGWERDVQAIQARGGRVAFVHFPVGYELAAAMETWKLRSTYWSFLPARTSAAVIHYQAHDSLKGFAPPDTSHLDMRDRKAFTEALVNILQARAVLPK